MGRLLENHEAGRREPDLLKVGLARVRDHRRRAAHEDEGVVRGARQVLADHVLVDEARAVLPPLRGAIERVPHLDARVLGALLQLWAQQDVLLGLVREDERHGCLILRVLEHGPHHLQQRGDPGATADHRQVLDLKRLATHGALAAAKVFEAARRAAELERVDALLQRVHVLGHDAAVRELRVHARTVHLDHEIDEALVVIAGDRGVRALHVVPLDVRHDHHVLADRKTEHVVRRRQGKAENASVVRHDDLLCQGECNELILLERGFASGLASAQGLGDDQEGRNGDGGNGNRGERVLLRDLQRV
mmetsp:Transcript_33697/g.104027  ORF Transcript_33697/g.104027 Transcript_33697/m.104027 type:complete len:305 (+) Transcript_33697:108-1022(+)